MRDKRIFTDQELEEMGTRTLDLVHKAIDCGNKEKAKELASRMYQEFNYLHDGYMFWVPGMNRQDCIKPSGFRDDFLTRE